MMELCAILYSVALLVRQIQKKRNPRGLVSQARPLGYINHVKPQGASTLSGKSSPCQWQRRRSTNECATKPYPRASASPTFRSIDGGSWLVTSASSTDVAPVPRATVGANMSASSLSIGQAVRLRPGSAWDTVVSLTAIGVVIGLCDNARFQVAFPTGDGRAPL